MAQAQDYYENINAVQHVQDISASNNVSIKDMQRQDEDLLPYIEYLESETIPVDNKIARSVILQSQDYILENGILFHLYFPRGKGHKADRMIKQLVIPKSLKDDVLRSYHDALGHFGIEKTFATIKLKYFWKKMYHDIDFYVKS